jgi:MFS family permease
MRPDLVRLKRAHRVLLYAVLALLFASGVGWVLVNYFFHAPEGPGAVAKSLAMKVHGAAAMAILMLIGMLLTSHVQFAWRARRNRLNGSIFLGVFAVLTLTGYALYYAGSETLRSWASWIHLAMGLALPVFLLVHILLGKTTRTTARRANAASKTRVKMPEELRRPTRELQAGLARRI